MLDGVYSLVGLPRPFLFVLLSLLIGTILLWHAGLDG